jgi:hypothetical protein
MAIPNGDYDDGVIVSRHYEGTESWLEIIAAEPRAMFSGELLQQVRSGQAGLDMSLDKLEIGGVLRIRGRNRSVLYRLVEENFQLDFFIGEWPD